MLKYQDSALAVNVSRTSHEVTNNYTSAKANKLGIIMLVSSTDHKASNASMDAMRRKNRLSSSKRRLDASHSCGATARKYMRHQLISA